MPSATSRRSPSTTAARRCCRRPAWRRTAAWSTPMTAAPSSPPPRPGNGVGNRGCAPWPEAFSGLRQSSDGATAPTGAMLAGEDAGAQRGALGAHIRSRIPALLDAWRAAIAADPDLTTGDSLPRAQLVDHLPPWLEGAGHGTGRSARLGRGAAAPIRRRRAMPRRMACSAGSRATTCTRSRANGARCTCAW